MKLIVFLLVILLYFNLKHMAHAQTTNLLQATAFAQKPAEVETFEKILLDVLLSKKGSLPTSYAANSKYINNGFLEVIYSVVNNDDCEKTELFSGQLSRLEVSHSTHEILVFTCDTDKDDVAFFRRGKDLQPLNGEDLLHLKPNNIINSGVLNLNVEETFRLLVQSFDLEFRLEKTSQQTNFLELRKDISDNFHVRVEFKQHFYSEKEIRWEFDLYFGSNKRERHARFLTISRQSPFYDGVYQHDRYFNGCEIDPINYLKYFQRLKEVMQGLSKETIEFFLNIPVMNSSNGEVNCS